MSTFEIILIAVGSYVVVSAIVTLAVTRFMRRVSRNAASSLYQKAERKRSLPRIHFRKSS